MEVVSRQITETKKEVIGSKEVFYQYTYDEKNPTAMNSVNFRTQDPNGKILNGTFSQGQISLNGNASEQIDFDIIPMLMKSVVEIINGFKPKEDAKKV